MFTEADRKFMCMAIAEAKEDERAHKVGAVLVDRDGKVTQAHGGMISEVHHAESALLTLLINQELRDTTLYTTLEPCTTRHHPHKDCAALIKERRITRVVIGIRDPNPNIFGAGERFLRKHQRTVEFAPPDLQAEIEALMPEWIREQRTKQTFGELFAALERNADVSPELADYGQVAVGETIALRLCPEITKGWLMGEINLRHEATTFPLPSEYVAQYHEYFTRLYDEKGFSEDGRKLTLWRNPKSYTDTVRLTLETRDSLYSYQHFYKGIVAANPAARRSLIQGALQAPDRLIPFPGSLCLHLVVATEDDKLLLTRRSPDLAWFPGKWAPSVDENMSHKDLDGGSQGAILRLGKRALLEELALTPDCYSDENLRILSVFLETADGNINVSLCGYARLNMPYDRLRRILRVIPRADHEFTAWDSLDLDSDELISEILKPSLDYHPTARFRMLMVLLHRNGFPVGYERFFA